MSVGGVEMPFERAGDAITTRVPPLLAVGPQAVVAANERCSASVTLTVSRLLARIPLGAGPVALLDWQRLDEVGALDAGLGAVAQASFTADGAALVLRGGDGRMAVAWVADGRVTPLPWRVLGPFTLAHGAVVPTQALLAAPTGAGLGLMRLDTEARTAVAYDDAPREVLGVATTLDGFRALALDGAGVVHALDRPFARTPAWSRLVAVTSARAPAQIAMAQDGAVTARGPLAAVFDASDPPAIVPMDSLSGELGPRVEVAGAAGAVSFVSGDVLAMDSLTSEVLSMDITGLEGAVDRRPLADESPDGVARTQTALTLYKLGAVVLRASPSGAPEGSLLHVLDYHREPAVEERRVPIAGLRGVAGLPGAGDPFVVWTARDVIRVRGGDGAIEARRAVPAGVGDVGLVVVHR